MKTHKLAGDGHDTRSIQNYLGHHTTVRLHRAVANAFKRFLARLDRAHRLTSRESNKPRSRSK
jgi:hypothetical protein